MIRVTDDHKFALLELRATTSASNVNYTIRVFSLLFFLSLT